jgi:hypothetical protein
MHTPTKGIKEFDQAIDHWIQQLDHYSWSQLSAKPSPSSWSIGQIYVHLIEATHFFVKQINIATSSNDNIDGEAYPQAKAMFNNDALPDVLLDGPPSNALTPQPESKDRLLAGLEQLKIEVRTAKQGIEKSTFKGKTKHFGLGYFTATEWLHFAEMHMRHHLRQKKRLDAYLVNNDIR